MLYNFLGNIIISNNSKKAYIGIQMSNIITIFP